MFFRTCLIVLTCLFCHCSDVNVEACSCVPEHPQQKYCKGDFAIKATVAKQRDVLIHDDGSVSVFDRRGNIKRPSDNEPQITGSGEGTLPTVDVGIHPAPILDDVEHVLNRWNRRPNYISALRSPEKIFRRDPGRRNKRPKGLRKKPKGPKTKYSGRKMTQYTITILKVYKTNDEQVTKVKHTYLYTPPPPLCNVVFKRNHTVYLILGKIRDGRMEVELCDYRAEVQDLNAEERKNLLQNMQYGYKCDQCQIIVCNGGQSRCEEKIARSQNPYQCFWKNGVTAFHPMASQFACKRVKSKSGKNTGKCRWVNGADRSMTPESLTSTYSK